MVTFKGKIIPTHKKNIDNKIKFAFPDDQPINKFMQILWLTVETNQYNKKEEIT